ncbi:P-loop containing nucleoside triphosphate hydrolase protein [Panus rudis PR-1116 ss-1]|nr:P-loop containing nucleoside triphosphate hydrolase protein [Panus rudis PR-1116 ss-1]
MDPVSLLQEGITALIRASQATNLTAPQNLTNLTATTDNVATATGLSTVISMFLSFSALSDWLKLFVFGGLLETCRRLALASWQHIQESLWVTALFNEDDDSYEWVMHWLSMNPKWNASRTVDVKARPSGVSRHQSSDELDESENKLCFIPSVAQNYTLWYRGHYTVVTRERNEVGFHYFKEGLRINIFSWDVSVLKSLVEEAQKAYKDAHEHYISIYATISSYGTDWRLMATRPKRPLDSIVLDPGVAELILEDARDFLESRTWYHQRGIPFRRGYLLYGAPGSGKTSIIQSIAGELGLNVYIISLSRAGLDDSDLSSLIAELPPRCVAIMEDIDAAMQRGITRNMGDDNNGAKDGQEKQPGEPASPGKAETPACQVTLSGLLNALDGIGAQEGRILFATTNRYEALDPALCRPGRMDLHIEFKLASKYQARELFKRFYLPSSSTKSTEEVIENLDDRADEADSTYGSEGSSTPPSPSSPTSSSSAPLTEKPKITGNSHLSRSPRLSQQQVQSLALRFADAIPEREFSMAALQGYLMGYKTRPVEAVNEASTWAEKELRSRKKSARQKVEEKASDPVPS